MNWDWPQITYLVLVVVGLTITLIRHGEPRREKYNIFISAPMTALVAWILYSGGFFSA